MGNPLSFHYMPSHRYPRYLNAIGEVSPNLVLILDASKDDYLLVKSRAPRARVILRSYDWSDGGLDVLHRARTDPVGTGRWMAENWVRRAKEWGVIDKDNTYFTGVNEYSVIPGMPIPPFVICEKTFAEVLATAGYKACIGNEGVGHPAETRDGKVDWSLYRDWESVIQKTGSILGVHEYWRAESGPRMNVKPQDEAKGLYWYAWRFMQCPFDVPIAVTEWGVDQKVDAPPGTSSHGWQGLLSGAQYASQLVEYCVKATDDKRFVGAVIFTHDYNSAEWATYDTDRGLPEIVTAAKGLRQLTWYVPGGAAPRPPVRPPLSSNLVHPLPPGTFTMTQKFNQTTTNPKGHEGTDFGAASGVPVRSVADGVVAWSDVDAAYGNYVRVWHQQLQAHSFYAHLKAPGVERGTAVRAGQMVGNVGTTGNSTGNHLHFEIRLANADGSYKPAPKVMGRCDPQTFCAIHNLTL